ncbi:zinc finger HIT domain-containing protein 2 [Microcaecilia unicolor]|uniref:Zinc finger HIT domain-containing protein 2 n=1 Tax=Microcaecilia unicolor TaxID=1415580 RepID=A0A6P7Z480_9AMPH|nr:zinc finger HIT domain-containing protein 2 [Microcaecilia unicolor]
MGSMEEEEAVAEVCGLCLAVPSRYTCSRCNVRFCSLPCYRGARHRSCSEAFYRRAVLEELRRRCPYTDATMRDILLRDWQSRATPGPEKWLSGSQEEEECPLEPEQSGGLDVPGGERQLWARLTPREKEEFQRLLRSGRIGALVPEWKPWWMIHEAAQLVQEEGINGVRGPASPGGESRPEDGEEERKHERVAAAQGKATRKAEHQGTSSEIALTHQKRRGEPHKGTSGVTEITGSLLQAKENMPPIPATIPRLSTLTQTPSPLVPFSVVNVLYAYTFSLKLYNGDLSEDLMLQEFCETVLGVSGVLNSRQIFSSTAEAMQAGVQAVLAGRYTSDPEGPSEAMKSVAHVLMGENKASQKNYTLAALSHLAGLLRNAKKLVEKECKKKLFEAQKKCEFLLAWANEHEDTLMLLAVEAQMEFKIHRDKLKEIEVITKELEKVWGSKKPPEKKVLIQELD